MDWKEFVYGYKNGHTWKETADEAKRRYPTEFGADAYNKVRQYLRRRYKSDRTNTISHLPLPSEASMYSMSNEYKADGTFVSDKLITICEDTPITPESILKAHGLQPGLWQVVSYKNNLWHSQNKSNERMVMYQSKLVAKPIANGLDLDSITQHFKTLDRDYKPTVYNHTQTECERIAEVNIADAHLGRLSWHGETGRDYDIKIARDRFNYIIFDIFENLKGKKLDYILFVWTNDFFNSDTTTNTTTGGTPQSVDGRWQRTFNIGVEMLVNAITTLSSIAPVKTFYTRSNHDEQTGYMALKYLEAWFRNNPSIEINIDAAPRKYHEYGNNLIGFGHGDKEKPRSLSMLMAVEAREAWGRTLYHEMHTAHLHSEHAIEELNGVIVRRISSPTLADTWTTSCGYIGAVAKAQTFVYDKQRGLLNIINSPVS